MKLTDLDYQFPDLLVAQTPAEPRDQARLLVYQKNSGLVEHRCFVDFPDYFKPGDVLVLNDTQVFPCRLLGKKSSGGKIECLLIKCVSPTRWTCLVKGSVPTGAKIYFSENFYGVIIAENAREKIIELTFQGDLEQILAQQAHVPLPPYIKRPDDKTFDGSRYQTIYARQRGSVAAPTAGFHFTPQILERLSSQGVQLCFVTLHVGSGTFLPIREEDLSRHQMHEEEYFIPETTAHILNEARQKGQRITCVGTTTVRTLESAFSDKSGIKSGPGASCLFIYPPYQFKMVDRLLTNFHQPKSTLLALVQAFIGTQETRYLYETAIRKKYRLFSYGDCLLISLFGGAEEQDK